MKDRVITNKRFRQLMKEAGMEAIELVKGYGYFYIISLDVVVSDRIMSLWQSSIYVCHFNDLTPEEWVNEIKRLFNKEQ